MGTYLERSKNKYGLELEKEISGYKGLENISEETADNIVKNFEKNLDCTITELVQNSDCRQISLAVNKMRENFFIPLKVVARELISNKLRTPDGYLKFDREPICVGWHSPGSDAYDGIVNMMYYSASWYSWYDNQDSNKKTQNSDLLMKTNNKMFTMVLERFFEKPPRSLSYNVLMRYKDDFRDWQNHF